MGGKKRRGEAFGVQGKMVSASARSGISGSDRVAQRGFLWVMHEVSPILLGPAPSHRSLPPALRGMHRAGRYSLLESGPCPFYRTGSYRFSMRGRTTDIDRLIMRLRGGPHDDDDDDDDDDRGGD